MTYTYEYPRPALTVDIVLFAIQEESLYVLLVRRGKEPFRSKWALPGGFVRMDESLEAAARRELEEETGLVVAQLEQLGAFGDPDRDPRGRVVTVVYCAVLPSGRVSEEQAGSDAAGAGWFPVEGLPLLAFDHAEIIDDAVRRLRLRSG